MIITRLITNSGKLVKEVKPKNTKIQIIETKTNQLVKPFEKNSRLVTNGDIAISAPPITKIGGIAGWIIFKLFIIVASKTHPIKKIVNPTAITEDNDWNSCFNFIENHINIKLNDITLISI